MRSIGYDPAVYAAATGYVAAAAISAAAIVNIRGVQVGAIVAGASSIAKFGALVLLVLASFALGGGAGASAGNFTASAGPVNAGMFGLALISVLWAYDGFADVSFTAGEVRDPQRTLPRAILAGTLAIIGIYLAANVGVPVRAILLKALRCRPSSPPTRCRRSSARPASRSSPSS